ncbi:T9SS type A sorting domain-containing protein [Belliella sp. DSM 111904]|uniref:T9SS type A sorting domain-containing protein n=1 Tax=Belliella filtrata TaxID=2923435 RepID=A0ABS9V085_9BACT|nr:T9SS type A sorting domain-containing protein [Belliella filtrata]MCH7409818.1 T9SS type A sorting domain-containing protein [Belliella filtrata]
MLIIAAGFAYVRPIFSHTLPAGTEARVKIGKVPSLLALLPNVSIQAYLGNSTAGQAVSGASLLNLIDGESTDEIVFVPRNASNVAVPYDRVEIRLSTTLSLGGELRVFAVYYLDDTLDCDFEPDMIFGSTSELIGGVNPVLNPYNVLDGNLNTFASLRSNVSLASRTFLTALFDEHSRVGDSVSIVLRNVGGLLNANLLASSLRVRTFLDMNLSEDLALNPSFLNLTLLPGQTDVYRLTYPTSQVFNRLEVSLGQGLLNALTAVDVFEMERIQVSSPFEISNSDGTAFCQGDEVGFNQVRSYTGDQYEWMVDGQVVGSSSSLSMPLDLPPGVHTFQLRTFRNGCLEPDMLSQLDVTVHAVPNPDDFLVIPEGAAYTDGDTFTYLEGVNPIVLPPNYVSGLQGTFHWYFDEERMQPVPNGFVAADGTSYSLDDDVLTIDNWGFRDEPYELYLAYTTEFGCETIRKYSFEALGIILPLVGLDLQGQEEGALVKLFWNSVIYVGDYVIERSVDGKHFQKIHEETAREGYIDFIDTQPTYGNNYYRLGYFAPDHQTIIYSTLVRVISTFEQKRNLQVFPNPVKSELNLKLPNIKDDLEVLIYSTQGQLIFQSRVNFKSSQSNIYLTIEEVSSLKPGVYLLKVVSRNSIQTVQFVKE